MTPIGMKLGIISLAGASGGGGGGKTFAYMDYGSGSFTADGSQPPALLGVQGINDYGGIINIKSGEDDNWARSINSFTIAAGQEATMSWTGTNINGMNLFGFTSDGSVVLDSMYEGNPRRNGQYPEDGMIIFGQSNFGGRYFVYEDTVYKGSPGGNGTGLELDFEFRIDEAGQVKLYVGGVLKYTSAGNYVGTYYPIMYSQVGTLGCESSSMDAFQTENRPVFPYSGAESISGLTVGASATGYTTGSDYILWEGTGTPANNYATTDQGLNNPGDYMEFVFYNPGENDTNLGYWGVGMGDGTGVSTNPEYGMKWEQTQGGKGILYDGGSSQFEGHEFFVPPVMPTGWLTMKYVLKSDCLEYWYNDMLYYSSSAAPSTPLYGELTGWFQETGINNIKIKST